MPKDLSTNVKLIELYNQNSYFKELGARIAATTKGDRIALMSMSFDPTEPKVKSVMHAVMEATKRGVETHVSIDAYAFMISDDELKFGPLFLRGSLNGKMDSLFRNRMNVLQEIDNLPSGRATIVNIPRRPFTNPIAGRNHIKISVVNQWASLGGCNLQSSDNLDVMVSFEDPDVSKLFYGLVTDMVKAKSTASLGRKDHKYKLDDITELLVDAGVTRQSIILETALDVINRAEEWIFLTCQYYPSSVTGRALGRAIKRGVRVDTLYNHSSKFNIPQRLWQKTTQAYEYHRLPAELFLGEMSPDNPYLHAKILATEKEVMIGSNNYLSTGVRVGTAEATMHRRDPVLAMAAVKLVSTGINRAG
jgi:phosphatidylserine/phosphatidylglycerophosphate/cardiolipin synthase-like enzyme